MKKLIVILFITFPFAMSAQMTYVPDDNFEQALIDLGYDSGPLDNYVPFKNIDTVTVLNISGKKIFDLTGIAEFQALITIDCSLNNIMNLDITRNPAIGKINCSNNMLTRLDMWFTTNLKELNCSYNQITNLQLIDKSSLLALNCSNNQLYRLDLTNNKVLEKVDCSYNPLTRLDISNNKVLEILYARYNPYLYCIQVKDSSLAVVNINWKKDSTAIYSENCGYPERTYIPDDNFEQALISKGYDFGEPNGYVWPENIDTVQYLDVSWRNISDLSGIADFRALKYLDCSGNNIKYLNLSKNIALDTIKCWGNGIITLDISNNPFLKYLGCELNQLITLDISNNPALEILNCFSNKLTSLDLINNPVLKTLQCSYNQLTSLDLSKSPDLNELHCSYNQITDLNISNNKTLKGLGCKNNDLRSLDLSDCPVLAYLNADHNPNLTCIQVIDPSWSSNFGNWFEDSSTIYSVYCGFKDYTYIPDDNFEQALIDLGYDSGPLNDTVPTKKIDTVKYLDVSWRNIKELIGIADFRALKQLYCIGNLLNSLDLSKNTALDTLDCSINQITSLELSKNKALEWLNCTNNRLMKLDLRKNTALSELHSRYNQYLNCIQVINPFKVEDDSNWDKDPWAIYSKDCNYSGEIYFTFTPDDIFEQELINKGYDFGPLDDFVPRANIDTVQILDVRLKGINDLTGIDDFIALKKLYCYSNELTFLDLTFNTELVKLDCSGNKLINLDISKNDHLIELYCPSNLIKSLDLRKKTALKFLKCNANKLTNLDLSNSHNLKELNCHENKISSLNINQCHSLVYLNCNRNQLKNLDFGINEALEWLYCFENQLTKLDLSKNKAVAELWCSYNQLTNLDLSYNAVLRSLDTRNNPNLYCIQVKDSTKAAKNHSFHKDDWVIYSENCSTVGVDDDRYESNDISISPNPASDYIEINVGNTHAYSLQQEINIYNSLGECVITPLAFGEGAGVRLNVSPLAPGLYFVRIGNENRKFIKY